MPSLSAQALARDASREAMPVTVLYWPSCMAGTDWLSPNWAVLKTPQRTFGMIGPPGMAIPQEWSQRRTARVRPLLWIKDAAARMLAGV